MDLNKEFFDFMKQQNRLNESYLNQISDLQTAVFLLMVNTELTLKDIIEIKKLVRVD